MDTSRAGSTHATAPGVSADDSTRFAGPLSGLTWAHLLNDGSANYLPGVLPAVLVSLDQPVRMAGVLVASLTIGQALQPVVGWFADRTGGRGFTVAGLLLTSLGGALLGVAHGLGVLVALLLLIGLGAALFHPQALAAVRGMLAGRHGLLTAVFLVGGELGRGVWPTAASLVTSHLGLAYLWIVAAPGLLTVPLLARVAPRMPPGLRDRQPLRWRQHLSSTSVLVGYCSVRAFTIAALGTFIPILWHLRGGTLVAGASIVTTLVVVGIVGNLAGGQLADRIGRRPVLLASALAGGVLVPPVFYLRGPAVWVAAGVLGVALFLTASTTVLVGQDIFPENRSMGSGIALGFANGMGALLVLVVGLGVDNTHDVVTLAWALAALTVASGVAPLLLPARLLR